MLEDGILEKASGKLFRMAKPIIITIVAAIIGICLCFYVMLLFFSPSAAMEGAAKSLYATIFHGGNEDAVDTDEMEKFWYNPVNVKNHLTEFMELISSVNNGMLYITKDNFEMILDKVIAYKESVRQVDNVFRYYQHHYKVVITYQGPRKVVTSEDNSGNSGGEDSGGGNAGGEDSGGGTSSTGDGESAFMMTLDREGVLLTQRSEPCDVGENVVFDIDFSLPAPMKWLVSCFAPTTVYADEITLSVVAEGEDDTGNADDGGASVSDDGFLLWPVPPEYGSDAISSKFGPRNAPVEGASTFHRGIDIAVPTGTEVYAAAAGKVITARDTGLGGLTIFIDHGNGYYTCYMHLSAFKVSVGSVVAKGDVIALSGNTGNSSGPHLHFGVYCGGTSKNFAVNPSLYFDGSYNLTGPNDGMPDDGRYDSPAYRNDTPISIAPAPTPEKKEIVNGEPFTGNDGNTYENVTIYEVTDYEDTMQIGHITNVSLENETLFAVSWHEIFTAAAMRSITGNAKDHNWETKTQLKGSLPSEDTPDDEEVKIDAVSRLDEQTINELIEAFSFSIGYFFDPTSQEQMPTCDDTYAEHVYTYDEMENYAYIYEEIGTNIEHGTEVFPPGTADFDYYEYKKPAIAPAIAENAYMTVEYDYRENGDGTATLVGRQVVIDGQAFYDYMKGVIGDAFQIEWYCEFIKHLPGAKYNNMGSGETGQAEIGSLADRFDLILKSYKDGEPYSFYDTNFPGVGKVILGTNCNRDIPNYTPRRDADGNLIGGGNYEEVDLNITLDDITDEQIQADIRSGLYSLEDLVYMASCIQAEAGTVDGQVAVAWCIINRKPNYNNSIKAVVTARSADGKKQFSSPWERYLDGSYSAQAQNVAAGVLRGAIANPIRDCYFFFTASRCWGYKPGTFHINIGGNMFYVKWGDVTMIKNKEGYVPF